MTISKDPCRTLCDHFTRISALMFFCPTRNLNVGASVCLENLRILALLPEIFFIVLLNFFVPTHMFLVKNKMNLKKALEHSALVALDWSLKQHFKPLH